MSSHPPAYDRLGAYERPGVAPTRRIVELACGAPSVHNTQPWRWRAGPHRIDLYADRTRQLPVADPSGRNLAISCGAALHHARVAAAALGYPAEVEHLPTPGDPDHLASMSLTPGYRTPQAVADLAALGLRVTDRRRFTSWPVPQERLADLAAAVTYPGVHVVPVTEVTDRFRVELLVNRALDRQTTDDDYADEQRRWIDHSDRDGVPSATIESASGVAGPSRRHRTRFAPPEPTEHDQQVESSDGLVVIATDGEDQLAWLLAGEALSEMWLAATTDGLSLVPLSQVIELPETRSELQYDVLGGLAVPQILARIGWQEIARSELRRTPRRPVDDVLRP